MSFEEGKKAYTYGIIAIICWVVATICNLLSVPFIGSILGIVILVLGIMAFVTGRKELAADPTNGKAKAGKIIGLVIIILEIVSVVLSVAVIGMMVSSAA